MVPISRANQRFFFLKGIRAKPKATSEEEVTAPTVERIVTKAELEKYVA